MMNDILVNRTSGCTNSESVQYKNAVKLTSKKLSRMMNSDFNGTNFSKLSTGNAPKNLIINQCYMADYIDTESKNDSKKRKETIFLKNLKIEINTSDHYDCRQHIHS
jgi:hypothetical protein